MIKPLRLRRINNPSVMCEVLDCGLVAEFWLECEVAGLTDSFHPIAACCAKHVKDGERLPARRAGALPKASRVHCA